MKKETFRQNLPAIIAISLPVLLVIVIGFLSILPNLGPRPAYDFIFLKETSRSQYINNSCTVYANYYDIEAETLVKKPYVDSVFESRKIAEPCYGYDHVIQQDAPDLFVYRTASDTVAPISYEDAAKLKAVSKSISPDGYSVSKRMVNRGIFGLFGGSDESGVYISEKNRYIRTSIDPADGSSYYDNDFTFITWIDPIK
jgi:hypothetical protein